MCSAEADRNKPIPPWWYGQKQHEISSRQEASSRDQQQTWGEWGGGVQVISMSTSQEPETFTLPQASQPTAALDHFSAPEHRPRILTSQAMRKHPLAAHPLQRVKLVDCPFRTTSIRKYNSFGGGGVEEAVDQVDPEGW